MTIKRIPVCTICSVDCSGANHRFCAWQYANTLIVRRWQYAVETDRLNDEDTIHLCGQACAHKLMDRFLAPAALERQKENEDGERKVV